MKTEFHRSLGLELSGSKNDRSFLAVLDWHHSGQRLILKDVEKLHSTDTKTSNDVHLLKKVTSLFAESPHFSGMGITSAIEMPPFFKKAMNQCHEAQFKNECLWLKNIYKNLSSKNKPFEIYLQRCIEVWLRHVCRDKYMIHDALGSNTAPLTARFQFLESHLPNPKFEILTKATLHRIVLSLGLKKNLYNDFTDLDKGLKIRELFLEEFTQKLPKFFIYDKDFETVTTQIPAFHSFLAALNIHLKERGQCEKAPKSYPKSATWIALPLRNIDWEKVF